MPEESEPDYATFEDTLEEARWADRVRLREAHLRDARLANLIHFVTANGPPQPHVEREAWQGRDHEYGPDLHEARDRALVAAYAAIEAASIHAACEARPKPARRPARP